MKAVIVTGDYSEQLLDRLSKRQLVVSVVGEVLAFVLIVGGFLLVILQSAGYVNWIVRFPGINIEITATYVGIAAILVALPVLWITKFHVKLKNRKWWCLCQKK